MNDMKVIFSDGANRIVETELTEESLNILRHSGKCAELPASAKRSDESLCFFMHEEILVGYALVKWERGFAGYRAIPIQSGQEGKASGSFEKLVSELFDLVADKRFPCVEVLEIFPNHQGQGLGNVLLLSLLGAAIKE